MGVVLTMTLHGHSPRDHQGIRARHHGKPSIDAASRERSARRKDCGLCNHRRGYVQVGVILCVTRFLFKVPIHGNLFLLLLAALFFIAVNLALGITLSTVARNQLQAMQMAMFVILPSILLSGFMFPFRGMPGWAQVIGEILPKI